jgi:hypothetical protein
MVSSPGFGSTACHLIALFRLGFPALSSVTDLSLRQTVTRRFILQEARHQTCKHSPLTACKCTVSGTATPLIGVLPTFPSRYLFTIGRGCI